MGTSNKLGKDVVNISVYGLKVDKFQVFCMFQDHSSCKRSFFSVQNNFFFMKILFSQGLDQDQQ